jgi:hypothetical protein
MSEPMTRRAVRRVLGRLRRGDRVTVTVNGEKPFRARFEWYIDSSSSYVGFVPYWCRTACRYVRRLEITSIEKGWS